MSEELIRNYENAINLELYENKKIISMGMEIAFFFNEGGWYPQSMDLLTIVEKVCKNQPSSESNMKLLLDIYTMYDYHKCFLSLNTNCLCF